MTSSPIRLAILNDYEVVVRGLADMLSPYAARVVVVEIAANRPATENAEIALYDTFAATQGAALDCTSVLDDTHAQKLVVYSWNLDPSIVQETLDRGADGYLGKHLPAETLVDALERVYDGEQVVLTGDHRVEAARGDWPGQVHGLSERESEVIALITQGLSNQEVADRAYLSINTVKSYIRSSYQKMGVTSRSQAVLWGIDRGFRPDWVRVRPAQSW